MSQLRELFRQTFLHADNIEEEINALYTYASSAEQKKDDSLMCEVGRHIRRRHAEKIGPVLSIMKRYYAVQKPATDLDMNGIMARLFLELTPLSEHTENVIFLDIDGVLQTGRTSCTEGHMAVTALDFILDPITTVMRLDRYGLGFLTNLCKAANATVVLCSTWRHTFDEDELKAFGMFTGLPFSGATEHFGHARKIEIAHYLMNNPGIKKAAILDDEKYTVSKARHDAELWQHRINSNDGITWSQMESISKFFGKSVYDVSQLARINRTK